MMARLALLPALPVLFVLTLGAIYDANVLQTADGPAVHLADDHMITMRVAWMMHTTGKPFFNAAEPVAASTSLFWPIILSWGYQFWTHAAAPGMLFWISIAMTVGAAITASRVSGPNARLPLMLSILLLPSFLAYGASGWEHIPQTLAVTVGLALILTNPRKIFHRDALGFLCLAVAFLMRTDTAPIIAVVWAYLLVRQGRKHPRGFALLSLVALAAPLAYVALMQHFYGTFLPNTYYLKSGGDPALGRGLRYLTEPLFGGPGPVLLVIATGLSVLFHRERTALVILSAFWAQLGYIAYVGGDVFPDGRFLLVLLPITVALIFRALGAVAGSPLIAWGTAALLLALAWTPWLPIATYQAPGWPAQRAETLPTDNRLIEHVALMERLTEALTPEDGSIGLHNLGMGYHAPDFHVVDFLGKAEPHIARLPARTGAPGHNKWDYDYAFEAYDIAVAPFPMSELEGLDLPSAKNPAFAFNWHLGRKLRDDPRYRFIAPDALGPEFEHWGLFLRNDLVERLTP